MKHEVADTMSCASAEKLAVPARKIFVEQLQTCSLQKDPVQSVISNTEFVLDGKDCWFWEAVPGKPEKRVRLEIVWIQGTVLESSSQWIVIHDGTGKVRGELNDVKKANKIHAGDTVVSKGMVHIRLQSL